jgi:hypothetical protein
VAVAPLAWPQPWEPAEEARQSSGPEATVRESLWEPLGKLQQVG